MIRVALLGGCVAAALLLAVGCGEPSGASWPQFRGPFGLGVSDARELPATWSSRSANVRWRTRVPGVGNSSPIIAAGRVFLTTAIPEPADAAATAESAQLHRSVVALDLATGKILWQTEVFTAPLVKGHRLNTNAGPTPVTDGELVYAYFGSHLAGEVEGRHTGDGCPKRDSQPERRLAAPHITADNHQVLSAKPAGKHPVN